jgi:hypothetical protein
MSKIISDMCPEDSCDLGKNRKKTFSDDELRNTSMRRDLS